VWTNYVPVTLCLPAAVAQVELGLIANLAQTAYVLANKGAILGIETILSLLLMLLMDFAGLLATRRALYLHYW
jgi:hypothetical protein